MGTRNQERLAHWSARRAANFRPREADRSGAARPGQPPASSIQPALWHQHRPPKARPNPGPRPSPQAQAIASLSGRAFPYPNYQGSVIYFTILVSHLFDRDWPLNCDINGGGWFIATVGLPGGLMDWAR